jgi:hypothetical protein
VFLAGQALHDKGETTMKQLITLAACLAVVGGLALPAFAQPNINGQPRFQNPGAPGMGRPGFNQGGWPGQPGQNLGPARPWDRPGWPGQPEQNLGPARPWDRPGWPGQDFGNASFPGGGQQKDRDERHGLGGIHIPHLPLHDGASDPHVPKGVPPEVGVPAFEFKAPTPRISPAVGLEGSAIRGASGCSGGGILTGIGGAIAALFGGLFGRKKES